MADPVIVACAALCHVGVQIAIRFYRNPADAQDTYPDTVIAYTAGWHYPVDSAGSVGVLTKYVE